MNGPRDPYQHTKKNPERKTDFEGGGPLLQDHCHWSSAVVYRNNLTAVSHYYPVFITKKY
jgi:hypothetical protein